MNNGDRQEIMDEALGEFLQVVAWRREIHSHPELAFREERTAAFIAGVLEGDGIRCERIAVTGILARIEGRGAIAGSGGVAGRGSVAEREASVAGRAAGRTRAVVLRADIDALPIAEPAGVEYASQNAGVMHACGHDMHAAMLLGALRILNRRRDDFAGTVFGLFQPGEEQNPGGALSVLAGEPFAAYDDVVFVGQHVEPTMPTGSFGFREGAYMASSDELRFTLRGVGGHAALREGVKDPVHAAWELLGRLYELREKPARDGMPTIISIGKVIADGATNVVPGEVYMEGTMRSFDEQWRREAKEYIRAAAAEIEAAAGVAIEVDISDGYPVLVNDASVVGSVAQATRGLFGADAVENLALRPTSDDFARYARRYPAVYYRLGVGGVGEFFERRAAGRLHSPGFCPDEKALGYGVAGLVNAVLELEVV